MAETIQIGEVAIAVTRKDIKHVHLSVHPPMGHVTLVAPIETRPEVARAYAISKLGWIRDQQATLHRQARETPRQFVERESHYLWGQRYLLAIVEKNAKPFVSLSHRRITLTVRPGSTRRSGRKSFTNGTRRCCTRQYPPLAARGRSTFSELRWYPPMEAAKGSLSWVFRAKQPESVRTGP